MFMVIFLVPRIRRERKFPADKWDENVEFHRISDIFGWKKEKKSCLSLHQVSFFFGWTSGHSTQIPLLGVSLCVMKYVSFYSVSTFHNVLHVIFSTKYPVEFRMNLKKWYAVNKRCALSSSGPFQGNFQTFFSSFGWIHHGILWAYQKASTIWWQTNETCEFLFVEHKNKNIQFYFIF